MRKNKNRKESRRRVFAILFVSIAFMLALSGCGNGGPIGGDTGNRPYEPDTPSPAPHDGKFVSDFGTMTFNGDGKTVIIDFDKELAGRLGLPDGEQQAQYEFRSGYMSPVGYVDVRYDVAMTFWITVGSGDDSVTVMVDIGKYEDGNFYTGTDCTTAERITFFVDKADGSGDCEPVDFLKS